MSLLAVAATLLVAPVRAPAPAEAVSRYEDLVQLFTEWRAFQAPPRAQGVPDYGPAAMARQFRALPAMVRRLRAIDTTGWSIAERVDWHLVRAEMAGLEFDHRVLRPWARNPAFYRTVFLDESDQPDREGPFAWGRLELHATRFPLADADAATIRAGLERVPPLLAQARVNLTGNGKDLWTYARTALEGQVAALEELAGRVREGNPELLPLIERARVATVDYAAWVERTAATKTGPSGIGVANYDWYLKHVQLVPYTWAEQVALMRRELGRARTFLALEEARNRGLPPQVPVASAAEDSVARDAGVARYMAFLRDRDVMTLEPWHEPALRAHMGSYRPPPREFFAEVDARDLVAMRTHGFHWFDLARMAAHPHPSPIRRAPLLYNIFNSRTEGWATGWEEMMLQAGLFDATPRSRELIYVLLGQRAARALGELMVQANQMTLAEAAHFATVNTPRGWLREDAATVWFEQYLYLQQPGYGTSYLIGKMEGEKLLGEYRERMGDAYTLHRFMDAFEAGGLVPMALLRWELTATLAPEVATLLAGQ